MHYCVNGYHMALSMCVGMKDCMCVNNQRYLMFTCILPWQKWSRLPEPPTPIMVMCNYYCTGNLKGTSHPHKSNTSIDDDGKSDVRSSINNSTGMH